MKFELIVTQSVYTEMFKKNVPAECIDYHLKLLCIELSECYAIGYNCFTDCINDLGIFYNGFTFNFEAVKIENVIVIKSIKSIDDNGLSAINLKNNIEYDWKQYFPELR